MALLPHTDYFYDLTSSSAYILLNGDADLLRSVIDFLENNHIHCNGSGVSRYPARSGVQYQWFIRVTDAAGAKPDPNTIHNLMRGFHRDSQTTQITELSKQLEELDKRLKTQVENNRILAEERERLKHTAQQHENEISQLWEELARYERIKRDDDEFIADISKEVDNLRQANEIASQQLVSLSAENEQLRQELSKAREASGTAVEASELARLMEDFETLLGCLMPNVRFIGDSLDVMVKRLDDRLPVLQRIGQIVVEKQRGTRVESARDWWEMHFNTGYSDNGRIYYRARLEGYDILVSLKGSQKQDIDDYLKRC